MKNGGKTRFKAIFLDRDGVINYPVVKNGKPYPPQDLSEFKLIPGVVEGIRMLKDAGFLLVVVTNQPDVGRKLMPKENVELIHQKMREILPLDEIRVCYDDGEIVNSEFRKPNPGMILASAEENNINLKKSYMVGDRWRDIDAGQRAGLTTIFIDHGYQEELNQKPHYVALSFLEAAKWIKKMNRKEPHETQKL